MKPAISIDNYKPLIFSCYLTVSMCRETFHLTVNLNTGNGKKSSNSISAISYTKSNKNDKYITMATASVLN